MFLSFLEVNTQRRGANGFLLMEKGAWCLERNRPRGHEAPMRSCREGYFLVCNAVGDWVLWHWTLLISSFWDKERVWRRTAIRPSFARVKALDLWQLLG
jgi:hypothetical protein